MRIENKQTWQMAKRALDAGEDVPIGVFRFIGSKQLEPTLHQRRHAKAIGRAFYGVKHKGEET